jgi:PAS domain S-box-containing protein
MANNNSPTILVADDDVHFREFLIDAIEKFPGRFSTIIASNGNDAVDIIIKNRPDIILLDINMPVKDGYEVCRAVRAEPSLPYIPIVLITGLGDNIETRIKGYEVGADDYITKPLEQSELYVRIKSILRLKELQDGLAQERDLLEIKVKERVREIGDAINKFELLAKSAQEFGELPLSFNIFKFIGHKIKQIAPDAIVVTGSLREDQKTVRIESVLGIEGYREQLFGLMHQPIEGSTFPLDAEAGKRFLRGSLEEYDIAGKAIAEDFDERTHDEIQKLLNIGKAYASGFTRKERLFGIVVLLVPAGKELERHAIVNAFINQFSVALQQRFAETTAIENEKKYRILAETAKDIPCTLDSRGYITYIGPQVNRYGFTQQEMIGNPIINYIFADDRDRMQAVIQDRIMQGNDSPQRFRFVAKNGAVFHLEDTIALLRDVNGSVIAMTAAFRDITERKNDFTTSVADSLAQRSGPRMRQVDNSLREIGRINSNISSSATILGRAWEDVIRGLDRCGPDNEPVLIHGMPYADVQSELIELVKEINTNSRKIFGAVDVLRRLLIDNGEPS